MAKTSIRITTELMLIGFKKKNLFVILNLHLIFCGLIQTEPQTFGFDEFCIIRKTNYSI